MKNYLLCFQCLFILNLSCFSVLSEDSLIPTIGTLINASENASSKGVSSETETVSDVIHHLEPSVDDTSTPQNDEEDVFKKQLFVEATSQNSGVANDITTSGQQVVITISDNVASELQQRAIESSQDEKAETSSTLTNETEKFESTEGVFKSQVQNQTNTTETEVGEEIPSFSEWTQKHLEDIEKNREPSNVSTQLNVNGKGKLRWKNYASLDCGAKVIASNPEAESPGAILSPSRDEYNLNTCTSRIWFIVELCEAIQAKKIDFANFELFSSAPKDFIVSVGDRFPTREWSIVGQFAAKDERDIQSFELDNHLFGKYIKVEVKSHYGSEHFCPISLFKVYGTSEFEVIQKEDPVHADRLDDDDDDDDDDENDAIDLKKNDKSKNLFSSATDAVISMVKKAAEVLGNKGNQSNQTLPMNSSTNTAKVQTHINCNTPSHLVVCDNCTESLFDDVYQLLSCHSREIRSLVKINFIKESLIISNICHMFGLEFCKSTIETAQSNVVKAFFPERVLGSMCNLVAVALNKVVLNVTNVNYQNETQAQDTDEGNLVNIETSEPHVIAIETQIDEDSSDKTPTLHSTDSLTKSTCSTDVSYTSQIKPTKTLTSDLDLSSVTELIQDLDDKETTISAHNNFTDIVAETVQLIDNEKTETDTNVSDSVEHLDEPLELDFNDKELPNAQTTQTTPQPQKESIFLRLSNRIKVLERNMSLSSQYLEELSKRYKRQVEEMQKLLDKTILSISEENKKKDEHNRQLEERLLMLTLTLEALIADRKSWSSIIYTVVISSLVTLFILTFCYKIPDTRSTVSSPEVERQKSVQIVRVAQPHKKKQRRPSDQALKIVRSSMENSEAQAKRKKRKRQVLQRSNSISTLGNEVKRPDQPPPPSPDWVEAKHLEEVPFVLEESEHSTLEPLVTEVPDYVKTAQDSRLQRVNGDVAQKSPIADESRIIDITNGDVSYTGTTPKKEKKGLRRIFKKVF